MFYFKVEFAVQMSGPGCAAKVQNSLKDVGSVDIDIPSGRVTVNTELPWAEIQDKIEKTGRRAVLSGFGRTYSHQYSSFFHKFPNIQLNSLTFCREFGCCDCEQ